MNWLGLGLATFGGAVIGGACGFLLGGWGLIVSLPLAVAWGFLISEKTDTDW